MFTNRTLATVLATLLLSNTLVAQLPSVPRPEIWIDSCAALLPTDKLGPFVHTADGNILAIDSVATYISRDDGKTWSQPRPLTGAIDKNIKVSNERAIMRTKDGTIIAAFMNLNQRKWTWQDKLFDAPGAQLPTWVMRSEDDGKTWTGVQKMHDDWSGAVRDMIQTKEGRVIFTAMKMQHDPGRHSVLTYSSTDDGKTWKPSNLIDLGGKGHHGGVTEPTLTELPDGRLWMLIRTNWGEFWSAYSYDGGKFWRTIQPSGIAASSAPGMLKRLDSGRLLLIWNRPYPEGQSEWKLSGGDGRWSETAVSNHREELSLALSSDDGKTWSDPIVIAKTQLPNDSKKSRWIAYPYVFEHKPGEIWLTTMQGKLRVRLEERLLVEHGKATLIDRVPFRVRKSGVYRCSQDLQFSDPSGVAISIEADDVTIDLNERSLIGSAGESTFAKGIHAMDRTNVTITNGRVYGFYFGIDLCRSSTSNENHSHSHVVSNVRLEDNWYFAARVMGSNCEIRSCRILNTGGSTHPDHTIPHGARLVGVNNAIRDCCIENLKLRHFPDGKGEIVGIHFDDAAGAVCERNQVVERHEASEVTAKSDAIERRFGLWINGGPVKNTLLAVRNNTFVGFTVPIVFAPGADGSATGNAFYDADTNPIRGKPTGKIADNRSLLSSGPAKCSSDSQRQ